MKTFTKISVLILVLMLALTTVNTVKAQDSKGTDFWLMFNTNLLTPTLTLFITSDVNTSGTVSGPSFAAIPFVVTANVVTSVVVPTSLATHTSNVIDNKGIHVVSLNEVTVYGLNYAAFTTDAYLGLPTDILGTDYRVLTYRNSSAGNGVQFGVVGTVNGTTVTITPTVTTSGRVAGVPYNIVLNQGETYQLTNTASSTADLTGTTITSTQPIGVMGSTRCTNIPGGANFCDHTCEMLPPTTTWGKNFVTVPLRSRINGDTWRIMASENTTVVTINGVAQPAINASQFIEVVLTTQSTITADKPVLVAQYSNGSSFSGNPGDPFMMLIPPYEQFLADYTVTTVSGYVAHYINVVAPNSIVGSMTLDGVAIPVVEFTPIGVSGFSGAQLVVVPGSHNLNGSLPFGVFQYGFNTDDSYGYPGGQSVSQIAIVSTLDVTPEFAINNINTQHCVDGLVLDQLNVPVPGVRVDYLISGANPGAGFAFTNAAGIAQFCYTGTVPGMDTIIGSTGTLVDTVFKQWDDNPLPVELASFTSSISGNDVTLNWVTSSEINNSGFDIERSANGQWSKVGYVAGNGTTTTQMNYIYTDKNLNSGTFSYRLKQIDFNGNFEYFNLSNEVVIGVPGEFKLSQNYPNPFNPTTNIDFALPKDGNVKISIFDNSGKLVTTLADGFRSAGNYTVQLNAANLSSGVYFYKLSFSGEGAIFDKVMKMSLIK